MIMRMYILNQFTVKIFFSDSSRILAKEKRLACNYFLKENFIAWSRKFVREESFYIAKIFLFSLFVELEEHSKKSGWFLIVQT